MPSPVPGNIDPADPNTIRQIQSLPLEEQTRIPDLLKDLEESTKRESARVNFLDFVKYVWPAFIEGKHHKIMAEAFERVAKGELKRLIVNMPPRHTKSEFASYLLPAWFLGQYPDKKIIQTAHTAELSVGFGRKVRNVVNDEDFKKVFPDLALRADSKAAGRWNTSKGGEYFAIGVGGAVTGKGADLLIIDDPHSEQEGQSLDPAVFDKTYDWYTSGPRQRLQPGGSIIIVMTRWHKRDLTGKIIKASVQRKGMDEWEVIEFPAILPSGNALWPEFWSQKELIALRDELPASKWSAQIPLPRKGRWSSGNGGGSGSMTIRLRVSLLSSHGIRLFLKLNGLTILPVRLGACSIVPMMMAQASLILSFWTPTKSAWSSLN